MLGIGIDTGGTCTDAVIYDFETREILGSGKALTTKARLEIGIAAALDELPRELVAQAEMIALSTTLATNACLENKGARAKLLMIGFDESMMDHLKDIYAAYGLKDRSRFVILDAKVEGLYTDPFDPDWEDLRKRAREYFADCDSVGIVQKHPRGNGGRFELTARKILEEELDLPITISLNISNDIDILKTCAGTMLNARLIPLISEFMDAVHNVMRDKNLDLPVSIVRSDGTMMSEKMAKEYPVETILCGPAASVVGGSELAGVDSGIVVDMGGTTTDIAIIKDKEPVLAGEGIRIGQWKTMVKGLYVETFGLGGDSAVRYLDGKLFLDTIRVIPISVLAAQYDLVLPALQELAKRQYYSACWVHEFYVLQKDITGKVGYTEQEMKICELLKERPLSTFELSERLDLYPRFFHTERLEQDGVLMKSGLTPTDIMILKGDFRMYGGDAARAAVQCIAANIDLPEEEILDAVYELVFRRMYHSIGQVILQHQYPACDALFAGNYLESMLDCFYEQAKERVDHPEKEGRCASVALSTDLPLIGVGAPIHVFLPRVARLLDTQALIPEYAGVANALGAAASRKVAHSELKIKAKYEGANYVGLEVFEDGRRYLFRDLKKAVAFGKEVITRSVRKKAALQGIEGEPQIALRVEENRLGHIPTGLLFEVRLRATATEKTGS